MSCIQATKFKSLCGKYRLDFMFVDLEHAELSKQKGMPVCRSCMSKAKKNEIQRL